MFLISFGNASIRFNLDEKLTHTDLSIISQFVCEQLYRASYHYNGISDQQI